MPGKARVLVPHCPHHMLQCGYNRQVVFIADEDYPFYLDNLAEWKVRLGINPKISCICAGIAQEIVFTGESEARGRPEGAAYRRKS